ncbi:MAG: hypothetical protein U9O78_01705 [Patescibacteria group bacterium]|nr:hypothetical protein [Patescibacteria group bacterium]
MKTISIAGLTFKGPYPITSNFLESAGVYVISTGDDWVDVGETDSLSSRITNHERKHCWSGYGNRNSLFLSFYPERNSKQRRFIESKVRQQLNPVCGVK